MNNEIALSDGSLMSLASHGGLDDLIKPLTREIYLYDTHVAGTTYLDDPSVLKKVRRGDRLILKREPRNFYDNNAILVLNSDEKKLGYIPRRDNLIFTRLMDAGKLLQAEVTYVDWTEVYTLIEIKLYLIDF